MISMRVGLCMWLNSTHCARLPYIHSLYKHIIEILLLISRLSNEYINFRLSLSIGRCCEAQQNSSVSIYFSQETYTSHIYISQETCTSEL